MTIIQAIILAIVEGLTEFLPVSSTAHMKFANPIIGVHSTPFSDLFEIVIQLFAILAVVVVYYKKFFDFSRLSFYSFQVLSILLPGFSRSGATIIGGMSQSLTRKAAAEFSFFLAVPTMLAASVKSLWDVHKEHPDVLGRQNLTLLGLSGIVTFFVAIIVIRFFIGFLQKHGFKVWGYYRIVVGLVMLVLLWRGIL